MGTTFSVVKKPNINMPEQVSAFVVYDNNGVTPFAVYTSQEQMETEMNSIGKKDQYVWKEVKFDKVTFKGE